MESPLTSAPHTITQIHVNETRGLVPAEYNCGSRLKRGEKNHMPLIITREGSLMSYPFMTPLRDEKTRFSNGLTSYNYLTEMSVS